MQVLSNTVTSVTPPRPNRSSYGFLSTGTVKSKIHIRTYVRPAVLSCLTVGRWYYQNMAARDSINTHLFNDVFQNIHGISLDQAREGWASQNDYISKMVGHPASPEEQDEIYAELRRDNSPFAKGSPEGPVRELARAEASIPHPIESAVHDWTRDSTGFLVGVNPRKVANKAIALSDAIRGGQTPTTRIYRGAAISPQEAANRRPTDPLSFTEDHYVARSFASVASRGGGKIYKVDPTTERGLYIPDIVGRQRTVGHGIRPEREWLIDPNTISGR